MKEKLNNSGFVVSTVIYAILILLIIFMFTILLLYRNTYRNQKEFNEEVKEELNDYLIESNTTPECNFEIENVGTSKKLIVNVLTINQDNLQYAFTEEKVFQENNYTTITKAGTYKAYVKDEYGNEGSCSIVVDFTKPTCELSVSGENPKTLLVTKSSDTIGISFDNVNYGSATTKQITSAGTYTVYVKDSSNNIGSCSLAVDFTKPTCSLSYDGTNIVITSGNSDLTSSPYSFDNSSFSTTNKKITSTAGTYKGYVKDTSNNVGECSTTLKQNTATFSLDNNYSSRIKSPTSVTTKSCLTTGTSCNITTPKLTVSSTSTYTYTAKGWSTSKNSKSATASNNASVSISSNVTYYPVISRTYSGGSSDDDGDCDIGIKTYSYSDGVCVSCVTGDANGNCVSCSCK